MNDETKRFQDAARRAEHEFRARRPAQLKRKLEALGIKVTEENPASWILELPASWYILEQLDLDGILLDLEDEGIAVRTP